jgi:hypothetical protein
MQGEKVSVVSKILQIRTNVSSMTVKRTAMVT